MRWFRDRSKRGTRRTRDAPRFSETIGKLLQLGIDLLRHFQMLPHVSAALLAKFFTYRGHSRFSLPFRTPPDLFHGLSPSHPCNPCPTSISPPPSPPATRRFPPWQSPSNLHSPCCGPSPSAHRSFSLRCWSRSSLLHGPLPLPSFRLWPHL